MQKSEWGWPEAQGRWSEGLHPQFRSKYGRGCKGRKLLRQLAEALVGRHTREATAVCSTGSACRCPRRHHGRAAGTTGSSLQLLL